MKETVQREKLRKIGYLGPRGTFSEDALVKFLAGEEARLVPFSSLPEVIMAVAEKMVEGCLVPIENSLEGSVNITLDLLAHQVDLLVEGEVVLPVHHCLLAKPGTQMEEIKTILSHPQALAQCRRFITEKLPWASVRAVESTGQAASMTKQGQGTAAVGTRSAAAVYGLDLLAANIEDHANNMTRFVLLGRRVPFPTGRDKTSLVFSTAHQPGCLFRVLQEFAARELNLTKIESRPARNNLGEYIFFVDVEGHRDDPALAAALEAIEANCTFFKFLGSYPRCRW